MLESLRVKPLAPVTQPVSHAPGFSVNAFQVDLEADRRLFMKAVP